MELGATTTRRLLAAGLALAVAALAGPAAAQPDPGCGAVPDAGKLRAALEDFPTAPKR